MNKLHIDIMDIIAAVIGAVLGMSVAFGIQASGGDGASLLDTYTDLVDLLIGGPAFAMLAIKRSIWETRPLAPGSSPLVRMLYLLSTIVGTLLIIGAIASIAGTLEAGGSFGSAWANSSALAAAGVGGLAAAVALDRFGLERASLDERRVRRRGRGASP